MKFEVKHSEPNAEHAGMIDQARHPAPRRSTVRTLEPLLGKVRVQARSRIPLSRGAPSAWCYAECMKT